MNYQMAKNVCDIKFLNIGIYLFFDACYLLFKDSLLPNL